MYDSDYSGFATEGPKPIRCKCNQITVKNVAFEGCWTGRRFLSCAGEVCVCAILLILSHCLFCSHEHVDLLFKYAEECALFYNAG